MLLRSTNDVLSRVLQGTLPVGRGGGGGGRGVHSSTFRLNVSAFCETGGAIRCCFRGCVGGVMGDQGVFRVYFVSETALVELKSGGV
jgi:hypothetical protein